MRYALPVYPLQEKIHQRYYVARPILGRRRWASPSININDAATHGNQFSNFISPSAQRIAKPAKGNIGLSSYNFAFLRSFARGLQKKNYLKIDFRAVIGVFLDRWKIQR
jgi:CRISPR/Cas system endoribonuclease Cas6 (RAMP superfamily)